MNSESYHSRISQKLTKAFAPTMLKVTDDSASHAGHAGQNPLGESHFSVMIVSDSFKNMSLIERHRKIYSVLADELEERVHALRLKALTPEENTNR